MRTLKKAKASAGDLERFCLDQLCRFDDFRDVSSVAVAPVFGSRGGNWTVRRITRSGQSKRPFGEAWTYLGLPIIDDLRRDWDLA